MDQDPIPDSTPFFSNFKDATKKIFPHIFSYDLPTGRHIIFSHQNLFILHKFCVKILFCKQYFSLSDKGRSMIRIRTSDYWILILEAQKHSDPQHWAGTTIDYKKINYGGEQNDDLRFFIYEAANRKFGHFLNLV
jgi:hypothetical protein